MALSFSAGVKPAVRTEDTWSPSQFELVLSEEAGAVATPHVPARPAWGWLYALAPLTILLLALTRLVPAGGLRSILQVIAVLFITGLALTWVSINHTPRTQSAAAEIDQGA